MYVEETMKFSLDFTQNIEFSHVIFYSSCGTAALGNNLKKYEKYNNYNDDNE